MLYLMVYHLLDWPKDLHGPKEPNEGLGGVTDIPGSKWLLLSLSSFL